MRSMSQRYVLTTNGGMEEVVRDELLEKCAGLSPPVKPSDVELMPFGGCHGRLLLTRPVHAAGISKDLSRATSGGGKLVEPALEEVLLSMRSIHDAIWHHLELPLPQPAEGDPALALYEHLKAMPIDSANGGGPVPPLAAAATGGGPARTFRVSCIREGRAHTFTSLDIEREVGGALHESYNAKASMTEFDLRVRVDVAGNDVVLIGTCINREPLSKRHKLAFTRNVTLKPTAAYALLRLGRCEAGHVLLDPCCGSGTLPLEAATVFENLEAHGVDKSAAVVKGAIANAAAAELTGSCTFVSGNCRQLDKLYPAGKFDCIVTNAPWGVQTANKGGKGKGDMDLIEKIYRGLIYSGYKVCKPHARMVILVLRWNILLDLARRSGLWEVVSLIPIRTSNLSPVAVVLQRNSHDVPKQACLEKLAALTAYYGEPAASTSAPAATASEELAHEVDDGASETFSTEGGAREDEAAEDPLS